jgi:prophage maintenance system killer protein
MKKKLQIVDEGQVVFVGAGGAIELKKDVKKETIWATQAQMAQIFNVNPQAVTKHLQNIYKEGDLNKNATCSKMEQVQIEGKRTVKRNVEIYNLDAMISVGYRINSVVGTEFRKWATSVLKQYITDGFAINKKIIKRNLELFLKDIKPLLPKEGVLDTGQILEITNIFADTWLSLDKYDKQTLTTKKITKKSVQLTATQLAKEIENLKTNLIKKGEASELFATLRDVGGLEGIVGNVMQSFGGKTMYESVEEKAAHLLYFIVKNHPFVDGNKRSGAFAFVWFLAKNRLLNIKQLNPEALTLLTIFVAESDPRNKNNVVQLIVKIIERK